MYRQVYQYLKHSINFQIGHGKNKENMATHIQTHIHTRIQRKLEKAHENSHSK